MVGRFGVINSVIQTTTGDFELIGTNLSGVVLGNEPDLLALLQTAHDKMDNANAASRATPWCLWCKAEGYDTSGLLHDDDCILVQIRHVIR